MANASDGTQKIMSRVKLLDAAGALLSLFLFALALWVLHRELRSYHFRDIIHNLWQIPAHRLLPALGLTFLSYLTLTGYDALALRYIQHPLPYRKISLASFIAYSFSNNLGMSMISGGSVRYRLYSAWGLSALEITKVVIFCALTFWLGFFGLAGIIFLVEPMAFPQSFHFPLATVRPIGLIFLMIAVAYFIVSAVRKTPLKIREWEFQPPTIGMSSAQAVLALLDWTLASSVIYVLLPTVPGLSYPRFLSIFLLAQIAGLISQVPGGLGVFESVVLLLIRPALSSSEALGVLLAYRAMYFILPLVVAAVLLGTQEFLQRREAVQRFAQAFGQQVSGLAPHVFAFMTFVGGALLLFYGATPTPHWRLAWLKDFIPLPVFEISHFLGSVVGMGLLLLARGLQLRLDAAYIITVILFGSAILASLLNGFYYREAVALTVMLVVLLPCRRYFYRKASLFDERFNAGWLAAIAIVLLCSVWLGLFSYKHVEYSGDLWWRFAFSEDAPRFLRASVGAVGLALFFALGSLLRAAPPKPMLPEETDLEKVAAIVKQSPKTYADLALLGDKSFLFSQSGNAFIMYGIEGRSWIAMGDPVGLPQECTELVWRFRELCAHYNGWSVFYQVDADNLPLYLDLGLTLLKLGEEGRVKLETFSLEGSSRKGMRHTINKVDKEGCVFEVIPVENVPPLLPELKIISDAWLAEKHTREKRFSLGFFNPDYLKRYPAGIVRREGKIIAFVNVLEGAEKEELSLDLMRYLPEETRDVMEYLFIHLMLWGKQQGYQWFSLGMAPLSGLEYRSYAPLWNKVGALIFRHAEHFYNLQGLRQYKEKFDPEWRPKYLASPGGLALPRILTNLAALISGGIKGVITK